MVLHKKEKALLQGMQRNSRSAVNDNNIVGSIKAPHELEVLSHYRLNIVNVPVIALFLGEHVRG